MPQVHVDVTERLLALRLGASTMICKPRVCYATARKRAPERAWRAEEVEGGLRITRIR